MWPSLPVGPNQYVEFRHEFTFDEVPMEGTLHISADSDYAVWLNGRFVNCGQFHDYPDSKTYDSLVVGELLRAGKNVLCVLVYYQGEGSFQYIKGRPGLIYALEADAATIATGSDASWRASRCYRQGPVDKITAQLGFSFEYDARSSDGWESLDYGPTGDWCQVDEGDITPTEQRAAPSPRPIGKLLIGDRLPATIAAQGLFRRALCEDYTLAERMRTDLLSSCRLRDLSANGIAPELPDEAGILLQSDAGASNGLYVVVDLRREEVGLFELEIEASEGQIIDIAWGEHLEDLRVRSEIWGRNFACRYRCVSGKQTFTHYFKRFGCRYIELHVHDAGQGIRLHYAGMRAVEYPVERRGKLVVGDRLLAQICETSVRTLHLCMHEHYEDCPWREQALYTNDSRNQALCGYYCFGEYEFPAVSFDLLGRSLKPDGYLELCAPAEIPITIPSFSLQWILELAEHLLYGGDVEFARLQYPQVRRMVETYAGSINQGLMPCPQGDRYWHFYDWAPGLDGTERDNCAKFASLDSPRFDAPLNMLFCLALESAARLATAVGLADEAAAYRQVAGDLRVTTHNAFWDSDRQLYFTYADDDVPHFSELTQALALLSGSCPEPRASGLRRRIRESSGELVRTTLSQSLSKYEAMLGEPEVHGAWVFEQIMFDWGQMLFRGATSFWETIRGSSDFGGAGSMCHGWSAIPLYFAYAYLLGVKPVEPGFRVFEFSPVFGVVDRASGVVPTPHGPIDVDWVDPGQGAVPRLSYPPQITCVRAV